MTENTSAFAYLRVSGLSQVDGDGFPRQIASCEEYASRNGIQIIGVYREEGITGKSDLDNRPALRQCIADLLANGTKIILIEKLDRLARDLMIQENIIQDLQRRGITLISVSEPDLCSSDPTRTLIRRILGSFFQYEKEMISSKLRVARTRIKSHGRNPGARNYSPDPIKNCNAEGRKPFGFHESESAIFEQMRSMKAQGLSSVKIAENLNVARIPTRYGKPWLASTVAKILARERKKRPALVA